MAWTGGQVGLIVSGERGAHDGAGVVARGADVQLVGLWAQAAARLAGSGGESPGDLADDEVELPEVGPVQVLEANRRLVELLVAQRWSVIRAAREGGASWEVIGAALGISRQGAHDWYIRKILERDRGGGGPSTPDPTGAHDPGREGSAHVTQRAPASVIPRTADAFRPQGSHYEIDSRSAADGRSVGGALVGGEK